MYGSGNFAYPIIILSPSTTYHYRAEYYLDDGWGGETDYVGLDQVFTTPPDNRIVTLMDISPSEPDQSGSNMEPRPPMATTPRGNG
jgi:hypothetical protein